MKTLVMTEEQKLVEFFRQEEGVEGCPGPTKLAPSDLGRAGDHDESSPAETAIRVMECLIILADSGPCSRRIREFMSARGVL